MRVHIPPAPCLRSCERIFRSFDDGVPDAGQQVRILHAGQLPGHGAGNPVTRFPVLYAPGLYVAEDDVLDLLAACEGILHMLSGY